MTLPATVMSSNLSCLSMSSPWRHRPVGTATLMLDPGKAIMVVELAGQVKLAPWNSLTARAFQVWKEAGTGTGVEGGGYKHIGRR